MRFLALVFLFLLFIGQTPLEAKGTVPRQERQISVRKGQKVSVKGEKLTVRFAEVVEDSRCPEGADCIWQGNAKIRLVVSKNGKSAKTIELNTAGNPGNPTEADYLNYKIKLLNLGAKPGYAARLAIVPAG